MKEIKNQKSLKIYVNDYINYLEKRTSLKTCVIYKHSLDRLVFFIGNKKPIELDENLINVGFRKKLKDVYKLSSISASMHMRHVRYFLEYLEKMNIKTIESFKIIDRELFRDNREYIYKYQGEYLDNKDVEILLKYWRNLKDEINPRHLRNELILELLIKTGLTVSELSELMSKDVDIKSKILKISYNKEKYKSRNIKIEIETVCLVKKYLSYRKDSCTSLLVAFDSWNPYILKSWPLTSRSIQRIVKEAVKGSSIKKDITPRTMRNTYFFNLINKGFSTRKVNEIIGCKYNYRIGHYRLKNKLKDINIK